MASWTDWIGPAIIGGSALLGGLGAYSASDRAAEGATSAIQTGITTNLQLLNDTLGRFSPYYNLGTEAIKQYEAAPAGAPSPWSTGEMPSPEIAFEFNPDDEMYKIQQEEGEEAINRALAARGLYDSRPAINALSDFNRKLIAEETERQYGRAVEQYGREYQQGIDKYNIENALAQANLGKYQDLVNLGMSATGQMGSAATQTGNALQYGQLANSLLNQGQVTSELYSGLGSLPANALSIYKSLQDLGIAGSSGGTTNALGSLGKLLGSAGTAGTTAGTAGTLGSLGTFSTAGLSSETPILNALLAGQEVTPAMAAGTGGTAAGVAGTAGTTAGAGEAGTGLLSSIAATPLSVLGGIAAAPLLGPTITGTLRNMLGDTKTAPNAFDYLSAYGNKTGIPEWGVTAEQVQAMDPDKIANEIGYLKANAAAGGSDISPTPGDTFYRKGDVITLPGGYTYTYGTGEFGYQKPMFS